MQAPFLCSQKKGKLSMKTKNELFYQRSYYVESQWMDVLGDTTYCIWKKLITHVDRSKDAMSKYGNKNTVPFSLTRLAEIMNMSVNKLKAHARKLWNYGLVDFVEWGACYKLGKKPLNIVVYNYPQNDTKYATKHIKKVRDYELHFESGEYKPFTKEQSAEIFAVQVNEEYEPFIIPEFVESDPEQVVYDDLAEVYLLFDDSTGQFIDQTNRQPLNHMNGQTADHSNRQAVDEHKYITNTFLNCDNADLIKSNTVNNSNAYINTSSSSLEYSKELNSPVEEEEITAPIEVDFKLIQSVLQTALETRSVAKSTIKKIINLVKAKQLPYVTVEMIKDQLDHIATEKEYGRRIFDFAKYFVNGLVMRIQDANFYDANSYETVTKRKSAEAEAQANDKPKKEFYNWLLEREDVSYA